MRLYPLHAILATAYKEKNKRSGNQNQGLGIDGERVVKSGRAKIRQAQKKTPRICYDTPSKDESKLVIYASLNTTPTTEYHRVVIDVMKKSKSEVDAAPTANNLHIKKAVDQREESQLAISK